MSLQYQIASSDKLLANCRTVTFISNSDTHFNDEPISTNFFQFHEKPTFSIEGTCYTTNTTIEAKIASSYHTIQFVVYLGWQAMGRM